MPKYGLKNFLHIANEFVNPETDNLDGIQRWLTSWFCFTYNTTPNDDKLLDMTIEELLVLYNMHRIKDDPEYFQNQITPDDPDGYEAWIKEEMGEAYETEEEMIELMNNEEAQYQQRIKKIADNLPDVVTTDFAQFKKD